MIVLGHHYQQDDIMQFADYTGDSLALAKEAAKLSAPHIIFCGVHFMAETADMLTKTNQKVILPDLNAGCSMADMADSEQIENAWDRLGLTKEKIVPVTYINCSADLKAFVGKNGGAFAPPQMLKKLLIGPSIKGISSYFSPINTSEGIPASTWGYH